MSRAAYDELGVNYSDFRRTDPRIEARVCGALGDARSVVNVGAGTGSYEPRDREVIAVEPSSLMIAKRPPGTAPALQGLAEALPLDDRSVDAAMAIFTIHQPATLRASSLWHRLSREVIERGQERLRADLESGRWDEVHGHLRTLPELDIGLRLISLEL